VTFREVFESDEVERKANLSIAMTWWIVGLVIVSSITAVVETLNSVRLEYAGLWSGLEWFYQINFSLELGLKLISCSDLPRFLKQGTTWIDCMVVLPFWIEEIYSLFATSDLPNMAFIRLLRLGKGLRLVKLGRFSSGKPRHSLSLTVPLL